MTDESGKNKSKLALEEEAVLEFWKRERIFEKTLALRQAKGREFVFYEGPPTANAKPGIHHMEARAFKDAIPRYKTMRGYYVRRKGGWDTHGLPVELQVEKELGLKSKKEIESFGVAAFNVKCKESVWTHVKEWENFTERIGYWVDLKNPYITYKTEYIESLWNIVKTVHDKKLLYKDYKVVPWCPRCGTALSSHELAQGYQDVKDLSVTVKFKIKNPEKIGLKGNVYLLAWTTTPWTLPGNVGLAVGEGIQYVANLKKDETTITSKQVWEREWKKGTLGESGNVIKDINGSSLIGLEYEPLYPFTKENISGEEKGKMGNAYKVYPADFVTTEEGTGIVHTAVMYGQDDFELGTKIGLPKFHLVNEDGTFKKEAGFLAGKFVKDEATDVEIIKDLAARNLLLAKEKYTHSYPFCWRCKTPLIYFARDSWYIKMSALRDKLVKENEKINWEPEYIKEGRFGEWLREVKDWAISRERYWGTPLPVWICDKCGKQEVIGSVDELGKKVKSSRNRYLILRHGWAASNENRINSSWPEANPQPITEKGKKEIEKAAKKLKKENLDLIFSSDLLRTKQTAEIIAKETGAKLEFSEHLREYNVGIYNGKPYDAFAAFYKNNQLDKFANAPEGGESLRDVRKRMVNFVLGLEKEYEGKNILIVSHGDPLWVLEGAIQGKSEGQIVEAGKNYINTGELRELKFPQLPFSPEGEVDLHRPHVDGIFFNCKCGGEMKRVKEVMDVWFDSGSMPFAQDHYPFDFAQGKPFGKNDFKYPADFISEAIDQTRGWFYTLHAVGNLMGKGVAYKNVVCLGHILDAEGKKMSKSIGNVVEPFSAIDKYGADSLRFWMYSVNQPGESKNFDEKTVDEVVKKVFNLASNVLAFYKLYAPEKPETPSPKPQAAHILDKWILARLNQLVEEATNNLERYKFLEPARSIRDFIADLSQWYLRRSRDRFKGEDENDKQAALATTRFVLLTLAKLMAPFAPFFAESLYKGAGGEMESVHLENWPEGGEVNSKILSTMDTVRNEISKALELRAKAGIKVRQPLPSVKINISLNVEYTSLIKDEVNVKEVIFDKNVPLLELDVNVTPELKKEGELREVIRTIQELRKQKGLKPGEWVVLIVGENMSDLVKEFESEIKKAVFVSKIEYNNPVSGDFELR